MNIQTSSTDGNITITLSGQMTLSKAVIFDIVRKLQDSTATPLAAPTSSTVAGPGLRAQGPERLAYTMKETADLLGVSYVTVHRLLQRGLLRASAASRHKIISRREIERFLAATTGAP